MLIGVCGSICAGQHSIAEYLVQDHNFLRLHLPGSGATSLAKSPEDNARLRPTVTDEKGTRGLTFPDTDALLDFVTKRWRENWVLTDIYDEVTLDALLRRPFFLLLSVDAAVGVRYYRFAARCARRSISRPELLDFVSWSDEYLYTYGVSQLCSRAHVSILNNYSNLHDLHAYLASLHLTSPSRLRPTWDAYFMTLASLAARRSNCMKRRVGCVLVTNSRIIATGYNGTPRGIANCNAGGCPRCNLGTSGGASLSTCLCLHAEENALLEAGRERIREGAVLYCDTCPCLTCAVKIAQVGIKEVVYSQSYNMDGEAKGVLGEAGVSLRQFSVEREAVQMDETNSKAGDSNMGKALAVKNEGLG